jgi:uncharacterized membrane protein YhaH (DUF805 family)
MNNPYSAPEAVFSELDANDDTYEPKIFSLNGRIGRLRYVAYVWGALLLTGILIALMGTMPIHLGSSRAGLISLSMIYYILPLIIARRRMHDLDNSSWFALLMLVPLLNVIVGLYLAFARGTDGRNSYGPMPAANTPFLLISLLIIPVGILAAIGIPQYQKYSSAAVKHAAVGGHP